VEVIVDAEIGEQQQECDTNELASIPLRASASFSEKKPNTSAISNRASLPSAAEKWRPTAFLPSKLYRFGVCLFHDLRSYPVCLVAGALKTFNYIE